MGTLLLILGLWGAPAAQAYHLPVRQVTLAAHPTRTPARLYLPRGYSADRHYPLIMLLHGYTSSAWLQELYMMLSNYVTEKGYILLIPEGTVDGEGNRFWNATDFCCDFGHSGVDDSRYLQDLIDAVATGYAVDPHRISLFGHSNGGFMANRLACDAPDRFAGIVSLAGTTYLDPALCAGTTPIAMLHAHGTADETIRYDGGDDYPGAAATVAYWVRRNGCTSSVELRRELDLGAFVTGSETDTVTYHHCTDGADVVHWRMHGMGHIPFFWPSAGAMAVDFLLEHRRR